MKGELLVLFLTLTLTCISFAKPPNLIVILTDDQGYQDVGFNGCEDIPTPHLDSIAANGIRFTDAYVTFPTCGPSRAGLLTGRYQDRFGFNYNPTIDPSNPKAGIPFEERNIAEVLREVDYTSMIIGKWHMGSHPSQHPLERGFDSFFGFLSGGHDYFPENLTVPDLSHVKERWEWYRTKILHDHQRVEIKAYLTDELSSRAVDFVRDQAQKPSPFFLYLAYNAPHTPLQATEKYLKRFEHIEDGKRRTYAAMVSAVDDGIGELLNALREKEILEDTLIIFLSDNGGATNNASINKPLRGFKADLWEGGIRVPFAMQWKGTLPEGVDYHFPISSLDILPTIAALAGASESLERPWDGVPLIPYLTGEITEPPHEVLFWRKNRAGIHAIRAGNLKLVKPEKQSDRTVLFNIEEDQSETQPIRDLKHEAVRLSILWEAWDKEMLPPAFPPLSHVWWE